MVQKIYPFKLHIIQVELLTFKCSSNTLIFYPKMLFFMLHICTNLTVYHCTCNFLSGQVAGSWPSWPFFYAPWSCEPNASCMTFCIFPNSDWIITSSWFQLFLNWTAIVPKASSLPRNTHTPNTQCYINHLVVMAEEGATEEGSPTLLAGASVGDRLWRDCRNWD